VPLSLTQWFYYVVVPVLTMFTKFLLQCVLVAFKDVDGCVTENELRFFLNVTGVYICKG
jgi:hypothetical protein